MTEEELSFPRPSLSFPRKRESRICIDPRFHGGDKKEGVIPAKAGIQEIYIDPRIREGDGERNARVTRDV